MDENTVINEAYYGKLPEFETIEKLLDNISKKIKADPKKCNPNKYPETKQIEKLFCKVFGFKKSFLYWEPFNQGNAYTVALNALILFSDKKDAIVKLSNTGFYDQSGKSVLTIYISNGLILRDDLSSKELLAVILHEIGHNFDVSKYHLIEYMLDAISSLGTSIYQYKKTDIDEAKLNYKDKLTEHDEYLYDHDTKRAKENNTNDANMKKIYKINIWLNGILSSTRLGIHILLSPFAQLLNLGNKKGEIFADSFPSAYGYSVELVSALNKLGKEKDFYYKPTNGVTKFLYDLYNFNEEIFVSLSDCHGTNQERCKDCLLKLQWDLKNNDFSPELKEELINKINETTDIYKQFIDKSEYEKMPITRAWHHIVNTIFGGRVGFAKFFPRHKV